MATTEYTVSDDTNARVVLHSEQYPYVHGADKSNQIGHLVIGETICVVLLNGDVLEGDALMGRIANRKGHGFVNIWTHTHPLTIDELRAVNQWAVPHRLNWSI